LNGLLAGIGEQSNMIRTSGLCSADTQRRL